MATVTARISLRRTFSRHPLLSFLRKAREHRVAADPGDAVQHPAASGRTDGGDERDEDGERRSLPRQQHDDEVDSARKWYACRIEKGNGEKPRQTEGEKIFFEGVHG